MPIIDTRNIPIVVELGPDSFVSEFTETTVTAQVMVGPTVVEFSWGELIPEPGLSGGGVFEGRVYIRPDIPTLPTNSEPVDPNADYLMLWDASSDTHVKVLAALGGGGGGGVEFATREETDAGVILNKALNPDVGAYAYDRLRWPGQHAAGKGTSTFALTDAATITIDCLESNVFSVTLGGNRTLATFLNPLFGQVIKLRIKQDATGNRLLNFPLNVRWAMGAIPVLSSGADAVDVCYFAYDEVDEVWEGTMIPDLTGTGTGSGLLPQGIPGPIGPTGPIGLTGPTGPANLDIPSYTAEVAVDPAADYFVMYDATAGAHRKVLGENLPGSGLGSNINPFNPPEAPNAADDEFDDGTFNTALWTRNTNFSSGAAPTLTQANGALMINAAATTLHNYNQSVSGTFKVRAHVRHSRADNPTVGWVAYSLAGLTVSYSTTKQIMFGLAYLDSGYRIGITKFNGTTGVNNVWWLTAGDVIFNGSVGFFLQLETTATHLNYQFSLSGHEDTFFTLATEPFTTHLTAAPDKYGFGSSIPGTGGGLTVIDFFRRIS